MQQQSFNPGHGGQSPDVTGYMPVGEAPRQPELPMPQIGDMPPEASSVPEMPGEMPDASMAASARPVEYWAAELEQILIKHAQNPKQKAEAIATMKRQYQQEILGINVPRGGSIKP